VATPARGPVVDTGGFDEALRWGSPLQYVFHTTAEAVEFAGHEIPRHEKVLLVLGAANRDSRRWEGLDTFTLDRDPSGHVAFGMVCTSASGSTWPGSRRTCC
jgi:cytochrome P450